MKWEYQRLARDLGKLVLYSELAKAGDPMLEGHSEEIALLLPRVLSRLRTQLQRAE